jgi:hypothetical protein
MKAGVGVGMHRPQRDAARIGESSGKKSKNTSPTSPGWTPTPHNNYGVAGEVGLALGWGCGIPEPLGICVAGYPDINPYVPSLCGATPGRTSRATRTTSPQAAGYPGCPCRGLGAGLGRADTRIESTFRCRGLPGHLLMHVHGLTGLCMRV